MSILKRVSEKQLETLDIVQALVLSLPESERDELLFLLNDASYKATSIAEVLVEDKMSDFAVSCGVVKISKSIQRYRRGETAFAKENGVVCG